MNSKLIADLIRIHNDPEFKLGWIEQTIIAEACTALGTPASGVPAETHVHPITPSSPPSSGEMSDTAGAARLPGGEQ